VERNVHTGFGWKTYRRKELGRPRSGWGITLYKDGNFYHRAGLEVPEGEYTSTLSLTSLLDGGGG
jgi:hypothetical protein